MLSPSAPQPVAPPQAPVQSAPPQVERSPLASLNVPNNPPLNLSVESLADYNNSETFDFVGSQLQPGSLAELSANSQDIANAQPPEKIPTPLQDIPGTYFSCIFY
jgi:hypothetical protein